MCKSDLCRNRTQLHLWCQYKGYYNFTVSFDYTLSLRSYICCKSLETPLKQYRV